MNAPCPALICMGVVPPENVQVSDGKAKLVVPKATVCPVKFTVADVLKAVAAWPNWFVGVVPATMDMAKDPVLAATTSGGVSGP